MEFETNTTDVSADISDHQRFAASTKRVTLAPLHDITREDEQIIIRPREDVSATVQVSEPNVYIPSESEDTSTIKSGETITSLAGLPTRSISRTMVFAVIGLWVAFTATVLFLMLSK